MNPRRLPVAARIAIHAAVGGVLGYAVLHPLSMLILGAFSTPTPFSAWELLRDSFTLDHLPMAAYFTLIGAVAGFLQGVYVARIKKLYEQLWQLSITDGLTGLYNRRHLMQRLQSELDRARRYAAPLSLIMIDVDRFKRYNDAHGHPAGDRLLRELAKILRISTRTTDIVGRYGGEEFLVVMLEAGRAPALEMAERLRDETARQTGGRVTLSLGVAEFPRDATDLPGLISKADEALYRAKAAGRNAVRSAGA